MGTFSYYKYDMIHARTNSIEAKGKPFPMAYNEMTRRIPTSKAAGEYEYRQHHDAGRGFWCRRRSWRLPQHGRTKTMERENRNAMEPMETKGVQCCAGGAGRHRARSRSGNGVRAREDRHQAGVDARTPSL